MLRRAGSGGIAVRTVYSGDLPCLFFGYDDGGELRDAAGRLVQPLAFSRYVREGWLLPGDDVGTWRPRTVAEGEPPQPERRPEMGKQLPTPQQTAILRRVSAHKLAVSFVEGKRVYSYGDGVPVKRDDAERLVRNRWVVPESPGLFDDEPQTYVCRSP
jgi:hypothetical protein